LLALEAYMDIQDGFVYGHQSVISELIHFFDGKIYIMKSFLYNKYLVLIVIILLIFIKIEFVNNEFFNNDLVSGTNYYIAPWGKDTNNGRTLETSWATLSHSSSFLFPGDTLNVVNGIYYNDRFVAINSGNVMHPITIRAYNGTPKFIANSSAVGALSFHNINHNEPGPISYYNIDGLRFEKFERAIFIGYDSHHFNVTNITTDQGATGFFAGPRTHHIRTENIIINGSSWNGWYIWHDNHDIDAINVRVTNQIKHSFFDLHTNNSDIRIINSSAENSSGIYDASPGIYMGHGDYGYDDNVTIINFSYKNSPSSYMIWAWNPGKNLYVDGATTTGGRGIALYGEGTDLTLKNINIYISNASYEHGVYFSTVSNIKNVLLENITITGVNKPYYYDFKFESGFDKMHNVTIRNPSGDDNRISVEITSGTPLGDYNIEFTDGKVFSLTNTQTFSEFYPKKSNILIKEIGSRIIKTYPMTVRPAYDSAKVKVNKFDTSLSKGNILVDFKADTTIGNDVIFTISTLKPNINYLIKKDSLNFTTIQADSRGKIIFSNSVWSAHTFTVEEY
jgi:hypothetical protein